MLTTLLADVIPAQERIYVFHCHQWREASIPESWFADLSPLEHEAAQRHTQGATYLKQRILRRRILATCCGVKPADIDYDLRQDKPRLYNTGISDFSIAHTVDDLLMAVVFTERCGVDYEPQRALSYGRAIATRFFTEEEQRIWCERQYDKEYFFYLWTLKEAAVKCAGSGMFADAKHYDFSTSSVLYKHAVTPNRRVTECRGHGYFSLVFTGLQTQLHYRTISMVSNHSAERIIQLGEAVDVDLDVKIMFDKDR